jgi:predicted HicB family RNase H-like nuclease
MIYKKKSRRDFMARNYQKENEWQKQKYKRIELRVDKKLGEEFVALLESKNISRNDWGTEQIKKFLKNNSKNT